MRRKRLQHAADTLCHMLCGWRQIQDKPQLVELGSGTLEIDALSGDCVFNGAPIQPLGVANELRLWLNEDLEANSISISALDSVRVRAHLKFSEIMESERTTAGEFYVRGRSQRSVKWHRCQIHCQSQVICGSDTYTSEYSELEAWPFGCLPPNKAYQRTVYSVPFLTAVPCVMSQAFWACEE